MSHHALKKCVSQIQCGINVRSWTQLTWYHLACRGLVEQPDVDWFCDDDGKENAGL